MPPGLGVDTVVQPAGQNRISVFNLDSFTERAKT
jgi:hypothetical protein